jgi:4a-hydroxytetrahydrobiopterin dehydratase
MIVAACGDGRGSVRADLRRERVPLSLRSPAGAAVTPREVALARRISEAAAEPGLATDPGSSGAGGLWTTKPSAPSGGVASPTWFQQMDVPRPQRNRIHLDISVPDDEARRRIQATLAAGGRLTYDAEAPAFWVLADPEGNEACITTWEGRDP